MTTYTIKGEAAVFGGAKDRYKFDFESKLETRVPNNDWALNHLTGSLYNSLLPKLTVKYPDAIGFVRVVYTISVDGKDVIKKHIPAL